MEDYLTVLHSVSKKHAAKQYTWVRGKKGELDDIKSRSYGNEKYFAVESIRITGFATMCAALERQTRNPYAFIIRGQPLPGINRNYTPRRMRPQGGEPATFAPAAHYWLAVDMDHLPAPALMEPVTDPDSAIEYLIGLLPQELHDACCWWQFTSSQSLPLPGATDTLSARLWFWLADAYDDAALMRWGKAVNHVAGTKLVDTSIYHAVQPNYVASPAFIGFSDPLPQRYGVRTGLETEVVLIIPPPAHVKQPHEPGEGYEPGRGVRHYLYKVGGETGFREPIKSAIASYITIHGASADVEPLKAAIRAATDAADPGGRDDATIERYKSDQHLDALIAAIRGFQGDKPGVGEPPEEPPDYVVDPDIPIEEVADPAPAGDPDLDHAIATNNLNEAIAAFNKRYAVVNEAGKAVVFEPVIDPLRHRRVLVRFTFDNLSKLYQNRKLNVRIDDEPVTRSVAAWWLDSKFRRQFLDGVVFDPTNTLPASYWNLWSGFAVEPARGDWSLLQEHVLQVICGGEKKFADYLFNLAARMFQEPDKQGEVAVVLRGDEGTGKGTFLNWLCRAFGQHGMHITSAKHLVGNFNVHLRDLVMLFADEAFFAGDRAHEGILKGLITENTIAIEQKYSDVIEVRSCLHIWMASNNDWVVPASLHARRFFVLDVADSRIGHWGYFTDIHRQMENGGLAAMIHELLNRDLSSFNARDIPQTAALKTQKTLSLSSLERWWLACLSRGFVWKSRHGAPWFREWHEFYSTELLVRSYLQWCAENHPYDRKNHSQLGAFFTRVYQAARPRNSHPVYEIDTVDRDPYARTDLDKAAIVWMNRPHGYQVGDLAAARDRFIQIADVDFDWGINPDD